MYHATVPLDADPDSIDPAVEGVDALTGDAASERLREAHLHNGQVEARGLFAPFFGVTAVGAALIAAWAMIGSERLELVIGWVALVAFANWTSTRRAMAVAAWGSSRSARPRARSSRSAKRSASPRSGRRCRPTPSPPSRRTSRW